MSGSFFGDGFGLPDDPIARGRAAFLSGNANDLDAKLESLALNDNLAENLDEDLDTFNDQTFDADVSEIAGKDFDFYKSTMDNRSKVPFQMHSIHHQQQQQQQQQQQGGAMLDFSQRLQNMGVNFQQAPGIPPPTSSNPSALAATEAPEPRRGLTLAELEARMIPKQQQTQQQQQQQQQTSTSIPVLQTLLSAAQPAHVAKKATADPDVIAKRREERQRKEAELERYNNMMTRHDKEFIIRIQISQLLTDDPAADDFYCHMYQLSRGALFNPPSRPSSSQPQRPLQQHQQQSSASDTATPRSANTPAPAGTPTGPAHSEAQAAPAQPDVQNPIQSNAEAQQSAMTNASQNLGDRLQTAASTASGAENKHQSQHSHHHHHHHLTRGNRSNTQSSMARMQQQVQRI
ncbi:DNA topoisomerase 2-associated protein pat1, partial [Dipsacomyces acuminosporus]